jgi:hypothetical protein
VHHSHFVTLVLCESNRHQRRAAPGSIFAGVESFAAQGVRRLHQERLAFEVHPTAGAGACVAGRGHIDRAALVIAAEGNRDYRVLPSGISSSLDTSATACKARRSCVGSSLPRFSARRRIPAHAVELKKNRCGIEPCSSTCDNEHTAASLGHSEKLGVEDAPRDCARGSKHSTSVCPFAPWCDERIIFAGEASKEATEGVVFGVEDSGHVFPEDDAGNKSSVHSSLVDFIGDFTKGQ